jgi:hypothetical protein
LAAIDIGLHGNHEHSENAQGTETHQQSWRQDGIFLFHGRHRGMKHWILAAKYFLKDGGPFAKMNPAK